MYKFVYRAKSLTYYVFYIIVNGISLFLNKVAA